MHSRRGLFSGLFSAIGGVAALSTAALLPEKAQAAAQRKILHVRVGTDDYIPTLQELEEIRDLFLQADRDPTGAIVVTRHDIIATELTAFDETIVSLKNHGVPVPLVMQ